MIDEVSAVLRQASAEAVLPRFQNLHAGQVEEKTPGEVVTIADREAERIITPRLMSLLPGSRVVGEEAAAETPALMDELDEGDVWLVDPLDGTANFVAGSPEFSVMVALLRHGQIVAGWLLNPVNDHLAVASLGSGAFIDGARIQTETTFPNAASCRGAVLTRFLPEQMKDQVTANSSRFSAILPGARCAGVDYPAVATGNQHFVMFWRLLPWDHAPGALLVSEAGGCVARLDGSRYRPSNRQPGLLVAQNDEVWDTVSREPPLL
ncbi:inositol monophosphatase [Microvirga sp. TS319]|uniref:inositol monophosphatase family protein n=1 Tax=Microvirga sp. TS319 TaxID=3241165 RepID=UPI00351A68FE